MDERYTLNLSLEEVKILYEALLQYYPQPDEDSAYEALCYVLRRLLNDD